MSTSINKAIELVSEAFEHWRNISWPEDKEPIEKLAHALELLRSVTADTTTDTTARVTTSNHVGFADFTLAIEKRLDAGAREYGDKSFGRDPAALLSEIEQELMDVCGWSYVLHRRVVTLRESWERRV